MVSECAVPYRRDDADEGGTARVEFHAATFGRARAGPDYLQVEPLAADHCAGAGGKVFGAGADGVASRPSGD